MRRPPGMNSDRRPTAGGQDLRQNPFASLAALSGVASQPESGAAPSPPPQATRPARPAPPSRGRVELRRCTAGRGGKTVTVVSGFTGIGAPELEALAKAMKTRCGTGGTVRDRSIEIQGDHRSEVSRFLAERGFRPVLAGG